MSAAYFSRMKQRGAAFTRHREVLVAGESGAKRPFLSQCARGQRLSMLAITVVRLRRSETCRTDLRGRGCSEAHRDCRLPQSDWEDYPGYARSTASSPNSF